MATIPALALYPSSVQLEKNGQQTVYVNGVLRTSSGFQVEDGNAETWTSSDPTVATVDASGTIKAVGVGSCTVTANDGTNTATVAVTITSY